jgi:hypothetical protein
MRGLLAAALVLAAIAARAETTPRSVNDCTLLTDPTALRACVDSFRTPGAEERRSDADQDSQAGRSRTGSRRGAGGASGEASRGSGPPR